MSTTIELPITGMTCASCANRIERRLNKLDGVTRQRELRDREGDGRLRPGAVAPEQLLGAVEAAGYHAVAAGDGAGRREPADELAPLRLRLIVSALLSLPVLLVSMIPALQFDNWQWLALNAATPVVLWGAWPFHKAAWANLKHGTATMDTLISLGVLAAWLWSLYALIFGDAGHAGHADGLRPHPRAGRGRERDLPRDGGGRDDVHPRRPLLRGPRQAPRRRGARPRCWSSAPRTWRCSTPTAPSTGSRSSSSSPATASSSARARRSRPTASSKRAARPST